MTNKKLKLIITFLISIVSFATIIHAESLNFNAYYQENPPQKIKLNKREVEIYKAGIRYYSGQKTGNFEVFNKAEEPVIAKPEINPELKEAGEAFINKYLNKERVEKLKKFLEERKLTSNQNTFEPEGNYENYLANYTN